MQPVHLITGQVAGLVLTSRGRIIVGNGLVPVLGFAGAGFLRWKKWMERESETDKESRGKSDGHLG